MQIFKWLTLILGALFLMLVATVVSAQHLYFMAALLLTLPGISYALGWFTLRGLEFQRDLPPTCWEGEEGELKYVVHNPSRLSRFFISIQEPLPDWIEAVEEPALFNVPANDSISARQRVRFHRRGVYQSQVYFVTAIDPLGVFAFSRRAHCRGEVVVYPTPRSISLDSLTGADRFGSQEFTTSALHGASIDLDGVRNYLPGDPLRRIHWRQTARTGQLSVIEYEESQSFDLVIALDLQRGSVVGKGVETTLEYAIRTAASLAHQGIRLGATVRLLLPENEENPSDVYGRGEEHLYCILDALARVEATHDMTLSSLLEKRLPTLARGVTLVAITSQQDRGLISCLAHHGVSGAHAALIYIDPVSFDEGRSRGTQDSSLFLSELAAAQVTPLIVCQNAEGAVTLQSVFPQRN